MKVRFDKGRGETDLRLGVEMYPAGGALHAKIDGSADRGRGETECSTIGMQLCL